MPKLVYADTGEEIAELDYRNRIDEWEWVKREPTTHLSYQREGNEEITKQLQEARGKTFRLTTCGTVFQGIPEVHIHDDRVHLFGMIEVDRDND